MSALAHFACFAVQSIFSGWNIIGSVALNEADASPMAYTLVRGAGSYLVMSLWCMAIEKPARMAPRGEDVPRVLCFGVVGGSIMPVFFLFGLQMTTPTISAIYDGPLMPVVVTVVTVALGVERISPSWAARARLASSVLLSVGGAIMIILNTDRNSANEGGDGRSRADFFVGNAFLLMECSAMAGLLILQKPLLGKYSPILTSSWMYGIGAVCNALLIAVATDSGLAGALGGMWATLWELVRSSRVALAAVVYLILIEGALAYGLLSFANKGLPSSTVSMYACAQPLVTSVLSIWLLGDEFNVSQLLGGFLVIAGLHFTVRIKKAQATKFERTHAYPDLEVSFVRQHAAAVSVGDNSGAGN